MRAAIYARITVGEGGQWDLQSQLSRLRNFAEAEEWHVVGECADVLRPGQPPHCPDYLRMIDRRDTWDGVLIVSLTRIHNKPGPFVMMLRDFREWGKVLVSVQESFDTSSAIGESVVRIFESIARIGEGADVHMERRLPILRIAPVVDPFGPKFRGPAIYPGVDEPRLGDPIQTRRGKYLEGAAQAVYGSPCSPVCSCAPMGERDPACLRCVQAFWYELHRRFAPPPSEQEIEEIRRLGGIDSLHQEPTPIRVGEETRRRWPTIASVLGGQVRSRDRYFGTPDRLDCAGGRVMGTEFKSGSATMSKAQRIMAKCWQELGIPISLVRLVETRYHEIKPDILARVPWGGGVQYGVCRTLEPERAGSLLIGEASLLQYWAEKGIQIDPDERVFGITVGEGAPQPLVFYPESLIKPVGLDMALEARLEPVAPPYPWLEHAELVPPAWAMDDERESARQDRIDSGSPFPSDFPHMTPDEAKRSFPERYLGVPLGRIEGEIESARAWLGRWDDAHPVIRPFREDWNDEWR